MKKVPSGYDDRMLISSSEQSLFSALELLFQLLEEAIHPALQFIRLVLQLAASGPGVLHRLLRVLVYMRIGLCFGWSVELVVDIIL